MQRNIFAPATAWLTANADDLALGSLVAAGLVGLMLIARAIGYRLLSADTECRGWRGVIGRVLSRTTVLFMVAAAIDIVLHYAEVPAKVARLADILFVIAAALQGAIWGREIVLGVIASRVGDDDGSSTLGNAMALIRVLISIALFAIALIFILDNLGVNVTGLVAGLGIGGIAIGLAAQGIFSDLFAALAIMFDRPFRRGDLIRYGATTGTVERIGLKTTRMRGVGGEQVIMANTKLLEQELHNLAEAKVRRTFLPFALALDTSADTLAGLAEIVAPALLPIQSCRLVRCVVTRFGAGAIDAELVYDDRSSEPDTLARHKSAVIVAVIRIFAERGIQLAAATPPPPAPASAPKP